MCAEVSASTHFGKLQKELQGTVAALISETDVGSLAAYSDSGGRVLEQ